MRPRISYLICCSPRSGSTLLCEGLEDTGLAGVPKEIFDRNYHAVWIERLKKFPGRTFVDKAIAGATTDNGVFGAKVFWYQFQFMVQLMRECGAPPGTSTHRLVGSLLPNLHYVWLKRDDKVAQAVSYAIAMQTNRWRQTEAPDVPAVPPRFDATQIGRLLDELRRYEAAWQNYFDAAGIVPLTVTYEELTNSYRPTIRRILKFLRVENAGLPLAAPRLRKQANDLSIEWMSRYYALTASSDRAGL
jgi:trehalose 2-sulfotransferase